MVSHELGCLRVPSLCLCLPLCLYPLSGQEIIGPCPSPMPPVSCPNLSPEGISSSPSPPPRHSGNRTQPPFLSLSLSPSLHSSPQLCHLSVCSCLDRKAHCQLTTITARPSSQLQSKRQCACMRTHACERERERKTERECENDRERETIL